MEDMQLLQIDSKDTVAIALKELSAGTVCKMGDTTVTLLNDVPAAHKVALRKIHPGENIIKYGLPIGHAMQQIQPGEHVHTHNAITNLEGLVSYEYDPLPDLWKEFQEKRDAVFEGYLRPDGRAGTRNELWIVPTVGCVNDTARILAQQAGERYAHLVDGVQALMHNAGCSQLGNDMLITQKILKGIINNPNAAGVLVISLGC